MLQFAHMGKSEVRKSAPQRRWDSARPCRAARRRLSGGPPPPGRIWDLQKHPPISEEKFQKGSHPAPLGGMALRTPGAFPVRAFGCAATPGIAPARPARALPLAV